MKIIHVLLTLSVIFSIGYFSESCKITANKNELVVGEMLELNCTFSRPRHQEHKALLFKWNGTVLSKERNDLSRFYEVDIKNNGTSLQISNTSEFAGNSPFYCGVGDVLACGKIVLIGYPPVPPENISCVSDNLETMTCRWDKVKTETDLMIPTKWTLKYRIGERSKPVNCPHHQESQDSCSWPKKNLKDVRAAFKSGFTYRMTVTSSNALNTTSSAEILIDPNFIVKPHPVSMMYDSSNYTLTMNIPGGLQDLLEFDYKILAICLTWPEEKTVEFSGSHSNGTEIRRDLMGLIPHSDYNISCSIKPKGTGFWSNPAYIKIRTKQKAPAVSPTMISFTQSVSAERRRVDVYWKSPEPRYCNGDIIGYNLVINSTSDYEWTRKASNVSSPITHQPLNMSDNYHVQLTARTKAGSGPYSDPVRIAPPSQHLSIPGDVIAERDVDDNGNMIVRLSWSTPPDPSSTAYRVFYCDGTINRPFDVFLAECKGELSVEEVDLRTLSGDSQHVYNITGNVNSHPVFGVSILDRTGVSGGITWAECLANGHGEPDQIREVSLKERETKAVIVEWSMMSCQVQIAGYQISYWPVLGTRSSCNDGIKQDFRGGRKTQEARVGDLKESTEYHFCVRARSTSGKYSAWSEIISGETTKPAPVVVIVVGTLVGIIFLLVLLLLFWIYRFLKEPMGFQNTPETKLDIDYPYYTDGDTDYEHMDEESDGSKNVTSVDKRCQRDSGHESLSRSSESSNEESPYSRVSSGNNVMTQPNITSFSTNKDTMAHGRVGHSESGLRPSQGQWGTVTMPVQLNGNGYVMDRNIHPDERQPLLPISDGVRETTATMQDDYCMGDNMLQRNSVNVSNKTKSSPDNNQTYIQMPPGDPLSKSDACKTLEEEPSYLSRSSEKLSTEPGTEQQIPGGYVHSIAQTAPSSDGLLCDVHNPLSGVMKPNPGLRDNHGNQTDTYSRLTAELNSCDRNRDMLTNIPETPSTSTAEVDSYIRYDEQPNGSTRNTHFAANVASILPDYSGFDDWNATCSTGNTDLVEDTAYSGPERVDLEQNRNITDMAFDNGREISIDARCDGVLNANATNTTTNSGEIGSYTIVGAPPNTNATNTILNSGGEIGSCTRVGTLPNTNTTPNSGGEIGSYTSVGTLPNTNTKSNPGGEIGSYTRVGTLPNTNTTSNSGSEIGPYTRFDTNPNINTANTTSNSSSEIGPYTRVDTNPNINTANTTSNSSSEIGPYTRVDTNPNINTANTTSKSGNEIGPYARFDTNPNINTANTTSKSGSEIGPYTRFDTNPNINTANTTSNPGGEIGSYIRVGTIPNTNTTNTTSNSGGEIGSYTRFDTQSVMSTTHTSNSDNEIGSYTRFDTHPVINATSNSSSENGPYARFDTQKNRNIPQRVCQPSTKTDSYIALHPQTTPESSSTNTGYVTHTGEASSKYPSTLNDQKSTEILPDILSKYVSHTGSAGTANDQSDRCDHHGRLSDYHTQPLGDQTRLSNDSSQIFEYHLRPLEDQSQRSEHFSTVPNSNPSSYSRFSDTNAILYDVTPDTMTLKSNNVEQLECKHSPRCIPPLNKDSSRTRQFSQQNCNSNNRSAIVDVAEVDELHFDSEDLDGCHGDISESEQMTSGQIPCQFEMTTAGCTSDNEEEVTELDSVWKQKSLPKTSVSNSDDENCIRETVV